MRPPRLRLGRQHALPRGLQRRLPRYPAARVERLRPRRLPRKPAGAVDRRQSRLHRLPLSRLRGAEGAAALGAARLPRPDHPCRVPGRRGGEAPPDAPLRRPAHGLYPAGDEWQLALSDGETGKNYLSDAFKFGGEQKLQLKETTAQPEGERANLRVITQNRQALSDITAILPDGNKVMMSSLRQFSGTQPLYTLDGDGTLTNNQSGVKYRPNNQIGFYQSITADGNWGDEKLSPGYTVTTGWKNFTRVFTDEGIQKPFLAIFVWTVVFSLITVFLTVAVGMVLACLVQWEALRGKAVYRVLLILPYAVPSFISILIFKGLFNQSFGEINMMLSALFGVKPAWFSDPTTARTMLIIVNTWLGYPYMMILCMGLLKAIPDDLYEASAMDGAGPFQNFFKITLPLLIKPLTPLMIASFAFNFNNFVLIQLLTNGGPDRLGTTTPAGYTDLLVNYTYRIAFEGGGGQDFGLAAAIATLIFLLVGALAIVNLKATRMKFD